MSWLLLTSLTAGLLCAVLALLWRRRELAADDALRASCHAEDLTRAVSPDHAAAGFEDCQRCHRPVTWIPAGFAHPASFPLTGDHALDCNACHTPAAPSPSFSCIDCHAHTRKEMDHEHERVAGYVYSSPACVQCHPDGRR